MYDIAKDVVLMRDITMEHPSVMDRLND